MAQHDYDIANQSGAAFRADLNNALQAIVSNNSGAAAPSTTYAHQVWVDTSTAPATIKRRDAANAAWITVGQTDGKVVLPDGSAAVPSLQLSGSGTDTGIYSPGADQFAISTGATERLRIDSSGRVGIGTSIPYHLLTLNKGSTAAGISTLQRFALPFGVGSDNGAEMAIGKADSPNNVGASIKLAVNNYGSDSSTFISFTTTSPGSGDTTNYTATERLRIDSSGDVLVGTTTVRARLTLEKAFAGGTAIDTNTTTASTTYSAAVFRHNGTLVGQITASTTATAYVTSSDYRLKENIEPVAGGITRLQQLNPCRFNFKSDPDRTVDGFIAHEVQAVIPEAIIGEKDAEDDDGNPIYQGIDQSKLVPLLTAALQEAIAKIETLEAKVAALESA